MLNFVICDDNINILNRTVSYLNSIISRNKFDGKIVFQSINATDILAYVKSNKVDVLILDIQLNSNVTGLELAQKIRQINKNCYIIFVSAHLEYLMLAYKYKTFDYIPKPFSEERLEETIVRLFDDIRYSNKNYIRIDNKNTLIDESEILYIKRDHMRLIFHTISKNYDAYSSFNKIQNIMSKNFIRCHKSFIININKIIDIDPVSNFVSFSDNSKCMLGPKYKNDILEVVQKYGIVK